MASRDKMKNYVIAMEERKRMAAEALRIENDRAMSSFFRDRTLYWAYGSNLHFASMARRCPEAIPYRPLVIWHMRLVFRGVADVELVEDPKQFAPGGLWWITPDCEKELDRFEGVARGLYVKRYFTYRSRKCLYYKMTSKGVMRPWESYFDVVLNGYNDFGLNLDHLYEALARSHEGKKTSDLKDRWKSKGRPALVKALQS